MKIIVALFVAFAACSPAPDVPEVEAIAQPLNLNARMIVRRTIRYDSTWDGVIAGIHSSQVSGELRAVTSAASFMCPNMWIWVCNTANCAPGTTEQNYFMGSSKVAIKQQFYPRWTAGQENFMNPLYFDYCEYEFREGGAGPQRQGIPVQAGLNYVWVGVSCPNDPVNHFGNQSGQDGPYTINVPAGSSSWVLPDMRGPAFNKGFYYALGTTCGGMDMNDPAWTGTLTEHMQWCQHATAQPGCLPGSLQDQYFVF